MTAKSKTSDDPVLALKCGGKKKKKMADGGIKDTKSLEAELYSSAGNMVGEYLESLITSRIPAETDIREDPSAFLKQRDQLTTTGNFAKNTAKGAGIGAAVGTAILPGIGTGAGAAIGAGIGAVATGAKELFTSKKKKEQRKEDVKDWAGAWLSNYADNTISSGYKDGGSKNKKGGPTPGESNKDYIPLSDYDVFTELGIDQKEWLGYPDEQRIALAKETGRIIAMQGKGSTANKGGIQYFVKSDLPKKTNNTYTDSSMLLISGYKNGGKVKGSGTAKSDSIRKNVEDGSFVVPAENAETAMDLGKKYLGWKGTEIADRTYPGTEVKLSNGEVLYTPEEVDILRYHGLDLNRLAPKAEEGNKMKKGGLKQKKYDAAFSDYKTQYLQSNPQANDDEIKTAFDAFLSDNPDFGVQSQKEQPIDTESEPTSKFDKLMQFAPEVAGAIQIGIAAKANHEAGKMPDINVSESLKQLTLETRKDAQYGLEPGTIAAMENQAEKARRDTTNAIVAKGGSAEEVMSNLRTTLSDTIHKKFDIELADNAAMMDKKKIYYNTKAQLGDQEYDVQKQARQDWLQIQEVNAGLLSAGIANIIGARKLKLELEAMKKVGTRYADISAIK